MLAKNYHYPYEAILSTKDAINRMKVKKGYCLLCRGDAYYPLYNIEQIMDGITQIKRKIKEEIEIDNKVGKKEEIVAYIVKRWNTLVKNFLNEIPLKVIIETGYKEEIRWTDGEGIFKFDINKMVRVNGNKKMPIPVDEIVIKEKTYQITALPDAISEMSFKFR